MLAGKGGNRRHNLARAVWGAVVSFGYYLSKAVPRDPRLWVFGNFKGYEDNPRYLLDHVRAHHPEIRPVWIARTGDALREAREDGAEAHLVTSPQGLLLSFRAGVGVIGNRLGDLNRAAVGGMFVVHLWHGTPLKRVLLDSRADWFVGDGVLGRLLGRLSRWSLKRALRSVDLLTAPSPAVARYFEEAFGLPGDRIPVTGYARTDLILESAGAHDGDRRSILYAPTWRESDDEGALWKGFDRERWRALLRELDAELVIKLHPLTDEEALPGESVLDRRIRMASPGEAKDVNRFLAGVDALVTDYSSIAVDYAVLRRPIIYFLPDASAYLEERGLRFTLEEMTGGRYCTSWDDVARAVRTAVCGQDSVHRDHAGRLVERFYDHRDTRNRERIVAAIRDRYPAAVG